MNELELSMLKIGAAARSASAALRQTSADQRSAAIAAMARILRDQTNEIMRANKIDMQAGAAKGLTPALLDRLLLTPARITDIANALNAIAALPDTLGEIIDTRTPANGLTIERVRIPIGVIGIIYESRPNVTADAGALCLKAGNAVILRGGSESFHSSMAIHQCLIEGLAVADIDASAIQYVTTIDRAAVGYMLSGLNSSIDLIVPRGGKSLVARVQAEARVPVLSHLDGICHTYVDAAADPAMARAITVNAKMRRTGVCGATETVLVHKNAVPGCLQGILDGLIEAGCVVRGDKTIIDFDHRVQPALPDDWNTEYLDAIVSVAMVETIDAAIAHIANHGSGHTESIITNDVFAAQDFLARVDSAIVMHNASTQFADGAEFGLGGEIGIATGRLHARGPVGVEGLTTYKYRVHGSGQVRP